MIGLISINHKTASLSRREQFALCEEEAVQLIDLWKSEEGLLGGLVLSTCNRLEIYYEAPSGITSEQETRLIRSLYRFKKVRHLGDESIFETRQHQEAIKHLFRLACGLESMVLGETQILGQLKEAFRRATSHSQSTSVLSRLCHKAFETAKKVRSEYLLSATPISAGAAAVDYLHHNASDFLQQPVLILGAGQMAEAIAQRLQELQHPEVSVYNRTGSRAELFATKHHIAQVFSEDTLSEALRSATIIFVATSSLTPIITEEVVPHTPLETRHFFDMAVPRNVDPSLEELPSIRLYTIDDLRSQQYLSKEKTHQDEEIQSYLQVMTQDFIAWCDAAEVREVIGLVQQVSHQLLKKELANLPHELTERERELVTRWDEHLRTTYTTAIVSSLRELSEETGLKIYSEATLQLFSHIQSKLPQHDA